LLRRIACFLPQPGIHEIHYFGVLAPNSGWRRRIVPRSPRKPAKACCRCHPKPPDDRQDELPFPEIPADLLAFLNAPPDLGDGVLPIIKAPFPRLPYLDWAALLKRVHGLDLLSCSCGGRRKIVAFVTDPSRARELLKRLGPLRRRGGAQPRSAGAQPGSASATSPPVSQPLLH
jgi:hypothetical protein